MTFLLFYDKVKKENNASAFEADEKEKNMKKALLLPLIFALALLMLTGCAFSLPKGFPSFQTTTPSVTTTTPATTTATPTTTAPSVSIPPSWDSTDDLVFTLNKDEESYTVSGYTGNSATVIIPSTYEGLPVTVIGEFAFAENEVIEEIEISDSVTIIDLCAFYDCYNLTSITIPASAQTINITAFNGCTSLTDITVDPANTVYSSIDGNLYSKDEKTLILYAPGKYETSFSIPNTVKTIDPTAFQDCDSLTSITIPSSVTTIGFGAFHDCDSLISMTIPSSVTLIDWGTFKDCDSLITVALPSSLTIISWSAFQNCDSLISIALPSSLTIIGESAFQDCDNLTSMTIPSSVTGIDASAFQDCDRLTSITIPSSVTVINANAFKDCDNLTIYVESSEKPWAWSNYWNPSNCPVMWGYKGGS